MTPAATTSITPDNIKKLMRQFHPVLDELGDVMRYAASEWEIPAAPEGKVFLSFSQGKGSMVNEKSIRTKLKGTFSPF